MCVSVCLRERSSRCRYTPTRSAEIHVRVNRGGEVHIRVNPYSSPAGDESAGAESRVREMRNATDTFGYRNYSESAVFERCCTSHPRLLIFTQSPQKLDCLRVIIILSEQRLNLTALITLFYFSFVIIFYFDYFYISAFTFVKTL